MKDAYSFHPNDESLKQTYQDMDRAYRNILRRCELEFRAVETVTATLTNWMQID